MANPYTNGNTKASNLKEAETRAGIGLNAHGVILRLCPTSLNRRQEAYNGLLVIIPD